MNRRDFLIGAGSAALALTVPLPTAARPTARYSEIIHGDVRLLPGEHLIGCFVCGNVVMDHGCSLRQSTVHGDLVVLGDNVLIDGCFICASKIVVGCVEGFTLCHNVIHRVVSSV